MPGPISDSYPGPSDEMLAPPRWAYPHLTDAEYAEMAGQLRASQNYPTPRAASGGEDD